MISLGIFRILFRLISLLVLVDVVVLAKWFAYRCLACIELLWYLDTDCEEEGDEDDEDDEDEDGVAGDELFDGIAPFTILKYRLLSSS